MIFSCLALFSQEAPVYAQLQLSPLFIETEVSRGRAQGVLTITNVTETPVTVDLYAEPFTYERSGFVSLSEAPEDLSPYLQFSPAGMTVDPQQERNVRLLSLFPPDMPPGEYRAIVFAEAQPLEGISESAVTIQVRVGTTVYARIGELTATPVGTQVQVTDDEASDCVLELLVSNLGEATARPRVRWQLERDGERVASGEMSERTVIAGRDRTYSIPLTEPLEAGEYTLSGELRWVTLGEIGIEPFELPVVLP